MGGRLAKIPTAKGGCRAKNREADMLKTCLCSGRAPNMEIIGSYRSGLRRHPPEKLYALRRLFITFSNNALYGYASE